MARNTDVAVIQRSNTLPMARPGAHDNFIVPPADVHETAGAVIVMLDMPGVSKDSINVTMEKGTLTVRASVEPYHRPNATMLFHELRNRGYYRVFNIGTGVDRTNVAAQFEFGVLTIKLFKTDELKSREIKIH